jgi:hypothetical protein
VDGVAEIDPEDIELSAAWRAALDQILSGENDAEIVLKALNNLPPTTIREFFDEFDEGINWFFYAFGNDATHSQLVMRI